jgi:hypothetical protein
MRTLTHFQINNGGNLTMTQVAFHAKASLLGSHVESSIETDDLRPVLH